ncbi:MAG: winged helix DNA-binding protein [Candidatus Nanohalobium sp.]
MGKNGGKQESLKEFFVNVKSAKILVSLSNPTTDNYASRISSDVDCTYSHTVRIIQKFEDRGLISSRKEGRKKMIELTSEGMEIAEDLGDLMRSLEAAER